MVWTDEAVEELKRMWDRGMTTGQIAKALGVTKNSIIGKVHRLCLTARPSPIKKAKPVAEKNTQQTVVSEKDEKTKKTTKTPKKTITAETVKNEDTVVLEDKKEITSCNEETNIPLIKLDNHTCRWPLGDPKDDDFCFCGKKIKTGQTYCEEHAAIAYVKAGKRI